MPRLALVLILLVGVAGCRPGKLAGERVGQYRITGSLQSSSCGAGHPSPGSLTFYVELRSEPGSSVGYWKLPNGPLVAGTLDDGAFRFEQRVQVTGVSPDPANGVAGCVLERAETVAGELAPTGAPDGGIADQDPALSGSTTIIVSPVPGGDCSPMLAVFGGAFPVLPCQLSYALEGQALDEPLF